MKNTYTPILDFVQSVIDRDVSRFFMPGHKGAMPTSSYNDAFAAISPYDITEITGADALYDANGIIGESEEIASTIYNSGFTCFSAGGSTLCIQTMLALFGGSGSKIIAARNAHISFINSCILLSVKPCWIVPEHNDSFGVSGCVTPQQVEEAIQKDPDASAVYITSPDYFGCISDVKGIAEVCKKHDIPLLVDNAHGAHLKLLKDCIHPIAAGASLCCDSAHKTLPAFTGAAYLHASRDCKFSKREVKEKMSLFGSTSPSYLIMLSLDCCNRYLALSGENDFAKLEKTEEMLWNALSQKGFSQISVRHDPTKLTLDGENIGKSGTELFSLFEKEGIECEYVGERHVVFMLSPQNSELDIKRFLSVVSKLPNASLPTASLPTASLPTASLPTASLPTASLPTASLRPREAFFSKSEMVKTEAAVGRISAQTVIKCPPGVPLIIPGEVIDEAAQILLKKSSISSVCVV